MLSSRSLSIVAACVFATVASAQVTINNGLPGSFVDISTTGTAIAGAGDDSAHTIVTTVGNDMFPAGNVTVTSNGYIVAGATAVGSTFGNAAITTTSTGTLVGYAAGVKVLCPFWDDLYATGAPNATLYWQEISGVLYIQYQNIGHFATVSSAGGPGITFQVQIYQGGGCNGSLIQVLYPDATFGGTQAANDNGLSATVGYIDGGVTANNAQYSFNTNSIPDGTVLTFTKPAPFTLAFSSPAGAGSLLMNICGGSAFGQYFMPLTFNPGAFPNGWLNGIDITFPELLSEIGTFPFQGPLDGSGAFALGPFTGLPSGLTFYAVGYNIPAGSPVPTAHSPAVTYTIP